MAETQVTEMVIKVDLGCEKCHKKIKKVLCAIPQIQNQKYDKKKNTVTITVVGCCPEKIKKKIYCKGGRTVKCVEIIKPPPLTTPTSKTKPKPKPESEPEPEKKPTPPSTPTPTPPPPPSCTCCDPPTLEPPKPDPPKPEPKPCTCCEKCRRGPCCHHFCMPTPPANCHAPCRRSECDIWGDGCCSCRSRGYYVCRSVYVYEDYPPTCKIM